MSHEVIYDYVEPIDPNLTCAICQSALVDPVTTTSCKHTFCRDCITRAIGVNPQCPIDRSALNIGSLRDTEQLVKLMLDELKVRCAAEECGMVMQRGLLLAHLRSCPKAVVTCQDGDCGLSMARHRLPHHRAYECFQRRMECKRCGTMVVFKDRAAQIKPDCCEEISSTCILCGEILGSNKNTHQWTCPQVRVSCPHTPRGCPGIIPRSDLQTHLNACPFEALSTFFEQNDARFRLLEQKNETLQAEVDLLKAELSSTRRNDTRQPGLGYQGLWGIRGNAGLNHSTSQPNFSITTDPPTLSIPQDSDVTMTTNQNSPSTPLAQTRGLQPLSPNNTDTTPRLSIPVPQLQSGYSPISSSPQYSDSTYQGITARAAADLAHHRSMVAPSFGSHQSYADWAFNRLSSNNMPSVEDAIHALRASVLQLAGGMDTMERRNEVRTMTESLRVLEEVGSLRAIVTTMRMQVMMAQPTRTPSLSQQPGTLFASPHGQSNSPMGIPINQIIQSQTQHHPNPNTQTSEDHSGEPVSEDTYLDPDRPHSIRESHAFSMSSNNLDAGSSTSSLITAYNATSRHGGGRTIGSGAGLTGRTVAIPPPSAYSGEGSEGSGVSAGGRGSSELCGLFD
uniref:E3 ubiquitin-protein ligase NRDP1 n=1 Tax=Kwoniella bestiolae CBS 10118 TaxID=1296100 RepID=A0A1B9FWQ5_9TREE|nr:hypothetical protein I302_07552 [Kwoniella bestiolae CBS 10118]OCF23198.1 hypothetical protein I302_07552 [Kwoniella bestiolae CBS 10118]